MALPASRWPREGPPSGLSTPGALTRVRVVFVAGIRCPNHRGRLPVQWRHPSHYRCRAAGNGHRHTLPPVDLGSRMQNRLHKPNYQSVFVLQSRPVACAPKRGQQQPLKVNFWCDQTTELYKFDPKYKCGNSRGKNFPREPLPARVWECPLEVLTQRGRRWALSSDLPKSPLNRR